MYDHFVTTCCWPLYDYLLTIWWVLGDYLVTTWWPFDVYLLTIWWPLCDDLVTTSSVFPPFFISSSRWSFGDSFGTFVQFCFFLHQDRNVTMCTAHRLCTVYTRVAALLAAQMTPPEIKLNYRRFSRTMIQREMKVNFDFSLLLMVEKVRL